MNRFHLRQNKLFFHFRHGEIVLSMFHQFVLRLKFAWFREASCEAEWKLSGDWRSYWITLLSYPLRLAFSVSVVSKVKIVYECYFLSAVCISERRIKWWPFFSSSADSIRAAMHPFFLGCSNQTWLYTVFVAGIYQIALNLDWSEFHLGRTIFSLCIQMELAGQIIKKKLCFSFESHLTWNEAGGVYTLLKMFNKT